MTHFTGAFKAPAFGQQDLDAIKSRSVEEYIAPGVTEEKARTGAAYVNFLCRYAGDILCGQARELPSVNEIIELQRYAEEVPSEAQTLKTDMFRLLRLIRDYHEDP